jgi:ABC-type multidrug transport system ATPase subunit
MRQKTAIACGVIRPFSLLVLDEPTIGLDLASMDALRDLLLKSIAAQKAVLLMTHSEEFAASVATRVLHIAEGRILDA